MHYCKRVLIFVFLTVIYIKCVFSGDECMSHDNQVGECKLSTACETIPFLKDVHRTTQQRETLRKIGCGFEGKTSKICCPNSVKCKVPNGVEGECKDIRNCTAVLNLAVIEALAFRTPSCNGTDNTSISICCPTSIPVPSGPSTQPTTPTPRLVQPTPIPTSISTSTSKVIRTCQATSLPPDPSSGCCGQGIISSRILGGNETELDQYPWLVLLEYRDIHDGIIDTKCGGTLISGRYVLTAAHCVDETVTTLPESVRLGEHDTRTNIDCSTWYEVRYCNNGSESIPIEKISIHAMYQPKYIANDIALVRLSKTVNFNDFIKPICLPSRSSTVPTNMYVAGWGATESGYASHVKMHVKVPYVDLITCYRTYPRLTLSYGLICAGGEIGKDSCSGDSGGPLMGFTKNYYEVLGIVSRGKRDCRFGNPGIYTNVAQYLDWISLHMRE